MAQGLPDKPLFQVTVTEGPSSEEWTAIKGVFVELYVHQGKKLFEVRTLLAEEYDFHATEKAYKRRIKQWKAYKNYKAAEKEAVADSVSRCTTLKDAIPSVHLHGNPIKWDRIKRFTRVPGPKRPRHTSKTSPIGAMLELDLHLKRIRPFTNHGEKILFLTKSYLDWNIAAASDQLGFVKCTSKLGNRVPEKSSEEIISRVFNKCFYDAIPLLLTDRTSEAFECISLACSLAAHCLQHSPYSIYQRLLRLYSYPLWGRFPDVRRQIVVFLHALASRTLPEGHPLLPLLQMWAQEDTELRSGRIASLLRLSSHTFGPASGLDAEDWAWVQDDLCTLSYQRKEFHDALRIAQRLSADPGVPPRVHITAQQMIARFHLHHGEVDQAESILLGTLKACAECDTEDESARFLQQTFSDLGYVYHIKRERNKSLLYYQQALEKAIQVNAIANISSLQCRIDVLTAQYEQSKDSTYVPMSSQKTNGWALWAFCRPYS